MEKATWEEIKALASDFKRTQAITLNQKLTERNCIDIINHLCNTKQLSLYFTTDGKTFLTPQELEKEIYEELEIANDRIELTKLGSLLDIDFCTIENVVNKMLNNDPNLQIVMGNLINSSYVRGIALKINELVKEKGKATILELTQLFILPKLFVEKLINNNLSSIIEAYKDGEMLYTTSFLRRHAAIIRGYLTRSSKPVNISFLNQKLYISEKLIVKIILELGEKHRIHGKLDLNKSVFVPDVHLKNQKLYLHCFFEQNNYIDFATAKEIGIQNPQKFAELEFPGVTILSSCALGDGIISQFEVALQDCSKNGSFVNCYHSLPAVVSPVDLQELIEKMVNKTDKLVFMADEFVISEAFISDCASSFDAVIKTRAEDFVRRHKKSIVTILSESSFHDASDETEKQPKGEKLSKFKSGGGQRGREIRVKTVKNKFHFADKKATNKKSVDQEISFESEFIGEDEALEMLAKKFPDEEPPEELLREIFQTIEKQLNSGFKSQCQSAVLQTSDTAKSKAEHQKLETTVSTMIHKIKLFEKGLLEIDQVALRTDLIRFNLKTLGMDLVNVLFEQVARDNEFEWENGTATSESRTKLISAVRHELTGPMKALVKSLKHDESFDELYVAFESMCETLDLFPKKIDKKTERTLIQELGAQYHAIIATKSDSGQTIEPGELLLVTTDLIFQRLVGWPLHASGKFVPAILEFLRNKFSASLPNEDWEALRGYQDYVVGWIKMHNEPADLKQAYEQSGRDRHDKVVAMALNWKAIKSPSC